MGPCTVYLKKYAHGFVVLCFVVVMQSFIMNSHEVFIHIHQGCFAGTGAIVRLPQCQRSTPDGYGEISQCITTTKHSKAKTVCIFLGIYYMYVAFNRIAHNFPCFMNNWTLKDLVRHIEFAPMMQWGQVNVSDTLALQMPGGIQYGWLWASMSTAGVLSRELMYLLAWCRWVWTFSMTECQGHVRPWVNWESLF